MRLNINKTLHAVMMVVGAVALGAIFVPSALAGCGDLQVVPDSALVNPANSQRSLYKPAVYRPTSESGSSNDSSVPSGADIVGMWKFSFVSQNSPGIPDDIVIDWGFTQWHGDGTEITNSATRAPATQNFCLGVWKKVGPSVYKLNHQALSYDPSGTLVGVAVIGEVVTVDRTGNAYAGTFSIDVYDLQGHSLAHVQGLVSGARITVD
jgi:hypothetical protein